VGVRDVVFDLGGVLVDWNPRYLFVEHMRADHSEVEEFLTSICSPEWHARLDAGDPFGRAIEKLAEEHPRSADWIRAYAQDWERMFRGHFDEMVATLHEIRSRGFRVHALSNYPAEKIAFLYRVYPFMRDFETVVISGLLHMTKPDPEIFRYVIRRIGTSECVFIDDRIENIGAARACGMTAIHCGGKEGAAAVAAWLESEAGPRETRAELPG